MKKESTKGSKAFAAALKHSAMMGKKGAGKKESMGRPPPKASMPMHKKGKMK